MPELSEQIDKGVIREKYDALYPKFQQLGEKIKVIIEHGLRSETKFLIILLMFPQTLSWTSINFR